MRQIRWEEREEEDKKKNESCWNGASLPGGFQMAVDDEILWRNPFNFEMKKVLINDSVRREAFSKRGMENVRKELEQVGEIQPKVVGFSIRREGLNEGRVQSKEQDGVAPTIFCNAVGPDR